MSPIRSRTLATLRVSPDNDGAPAGNRHGVPATVPSSVTTATIRLAIPAVRPTTKKIRPHDRSRALVYMEILAENFTRWLAMT